MANVMKSHSFFAALGIASLLSVVFTTQTAHAQASLPVRVTNTPAVTVGNPVTVGNNSSNPVSTRDADHPANEPFSVHLCAFNDFDGVSPCEGVHRSAAVPTTRSGKTVKRLVIEYVSGKCEMSRADTFLLSIELGVDEGLASERIHYLVPVSVPNVSGGPNMYAIAQQTRIYVDPGQNVGIGLELRGASADNWDTVCHFQVEGSLITQ
ncbi:MAG TPA: hypothetical protein VGF08_09255 [Terriglobales bacterium]|jgi:hypothetical protein